MRISAFSIAPAMAAALTLSAAASPEGFDNAAGYWFGGTLNVSPFLNLSYQRDDNVNGLREYGKQRARERGLSRQFDDANAFVIKGGLNFLLPGNHWRLDGRAFIHNEQYSNVDADDRTDYYEMVILKGWTDGGTTWFIRERYQDIRYDDDFELAENDRKVFELVAGGEMAVTDKSKVRASAGYLDYNYDDRAGDDYNRIHGTVGFAHTLTEKTDWTVSATYTTFDRDRYDTNAYGVDGKIGLRTRSTDKLTFDASIGAEYFRDYKYNMYAADGTFLGRKSKGDDETSFVYDIGGSWKIDKRLSLRVSGRSEYEPSQDVYDNSLFENSISSVLTYTPGDHWKLTAGVSYERDEYNRKVARRTDLNGNPYSSVESGGSKRTDDEMRYFATVAYAITRYCSVYANFRYTDISSSIDGYDYDRTRYGAGVTLKY